MPTTIRQQLAQITHRHYQHFLAVARHILSMLVTVAVFMSCIGVSLALNLP